VKFKYREWRRLYRDEEGEFAQLPWFARAAGAELLKPCDDAGRIHVGDLRPDETPALGLARVIAFRMGATRGDRRLMAQLFPLLFEEGYLVWKAPYVVVRNYVAAQRRWDDEDEPPPPAGVPAPTPAGPAQPPPPAPRSDHDGATTVQRSDHEATTTAQRQGNDSATKENVTPRNHSAEIGSARAYARSSVLCSADLPTTPPNPPSGEGGSPSGSFGGLADPDEPPRLPTVEHALNPDPMEFRMTLGGACGYGLGASGEEDLALKGHLRALFGQAGYGMPSARVAGAFLVAGGLRAKRISRVDTGWLIRSRGGNLRWLLEAARDWDRAGRPLLDERGQHAPPKPAAPPPAPARRSVHHTGEQAKIRRAIEEAEAAYEARQAAAGGGATVTVIPLPARTVGRG
jgi:hypothetical protein